MTKSGERPLKHELKRVGVRPLRVGVWLTTEGAYASAPAAATSTIPTGFIFDFQNGFVAT